MSDKIVKHNVQTTVGATEDLQVTIEVTPEQLINDPLYETMTPVATPEGLAFVPSKDVASTAGTAIPAFTHARVRDLRDENLIELGAWREVARQVLGRSADHSDMPPATPADVLHRFQTLRMTIDAERKAMQREVAEQLKMTAPDRTRDRTRLVTLETLLVKAIAWRDWDGSKTSIATGRPDPQDDLETCINIIAPKVDNAILCPDCQRDPDPRGWTACAACRRLNGWS